jgi:hypothetical protein
VEKINLYKKKIIHIKIIILMPNPAAISFGISVPNVATFAITSPASLTSSGATVINGNIGISPGNTVTGSPFITGTTYLNPDVEAATAQTDVDTIWSDLSTRVVDSTLATALDTQTVVGGVYDFTGGIADLAVGGNFTLDGSAYGTGSIFIFIVGTTLTMNIGSTVNLINGAKASNVYWVVGTDALVDAGSIFKGTIMAVGNIVGGQGADFVGNLWAGASFAGAGNVTLDTNTIVSQSIAASAGDPHVICIDGSRLDAHDEGFYRVLGYQGKQENDSIIFNAKIARNSLSKEDYYSHAWLKIKNIDLSFFILFSGKNIVIVNEQTNKVIKGSKWTYKYETADGNYFKFNIESKCNAISIETSGQNGDINISGLFAGTIMKIKQLKDESVDNFRLIEPSFYQFNASYSGSIAPHVKTSIGNCVNIKSNIYRLAQWSDKIDSKQKLVSSGSINARTDENGIIRQLNSVVTYKSGIKVNNEWTWTGEKHWNLVCKHNGKIVEKFSMDNINIPVTAKGFILLRVQDNGSISMAFRRCHYLVSGLFINDEIKLDSLNDITFKNIEKSDMIMNDSKEDSIMSKHIAPFYKLD